MDQNHFISCFSALFEETDPSQIFPEKKFRELEEWSSMIGLSVIAMADEEYHVRLTGEDIRNSIIINDIFEKIRSKKNP